LGRGGAFFGDLPGDLPSDLRRSRPREGGVPGSKGVGLLLRCEDLFLVCLGVRERPPVDDLREDFRRQAGEVDGEVSGGCLTEPLASLRRSEVSCLRGLVGDGVRSCVVSDAFPLIHHDAFCVLLLFFLDDGDVRSFVAFVNASMEALLRLRLDLDFSDPPPLEWSFVFTRLPVRIGSIEAMCSEGWLEDFLGRAGAAPTGSSDSGLSASMDICRVGAIKGPQMPATCRSRSPGDANRSSGATKSIRFFRKTTGSLEEESPTEWGVGCFGNL